MSRAGGMDDERFGIADIGQVREQFYMANEPFPCFQTAFDSKAEDGAIPMRMVLRGQLVLWMACETGIADPTNGGMRLQEFGHAQGVLAVPLHAQWERLQSL